MKLYEEFKLYENLWMLNEDHPGITSLWQPNGKKDDSINDYTDDESFEKFFSNFDSKLVKTFVSGWEFKGSSDANSVEYYYYENTKLRENRIIEAYIGFLRPRSAASKKDHVVNFEYDFNDPRKHSAFNKIEYKHFPKDTYTAEHIVSIGLLYASLTLGDIDQNELNTRLAELRSHFASHIQNHKASSIGSPESDLAQNELSAECINNFDKSLIKTYIGKWELVNTEVLPNMEKLVYKGINTYTEKGWFDDQENTEEFRVDIQFIRPSSKKDHYLIRAFCDDGWDRNSMHEKFLKESYTIEQIVSIVLLWASNKFGWVKEAEYNTNLRDLQKHFNKLLKNKHSVVNEWVDASGKNVKAPTGQTTATSTATSLAKKKKVKTVFGMAYTWRDEFSKLYKHIMEVNKPVSGVRDSGMWDTLFRAYWIAVDGLEYRLEVTTTELVNFKSIEKWDYVLSVMDPTEKVVSRGYLRDYDHLLDVLLKAGVITDKSKCI